MNENDSAPTQDDFQSALVAEFTPASDNTTPPAPAPTSDEGAGDATPPVAGAEVPPVDNKPSDGEPPKPQGGEEDAPKDGEQPKPGEATDIPKETPEEKANREAQEAANKEEPKPLTAEDIKKVLDERESSSQERVSQLHEAREAIISKVYPEGIDTKIYDTDGKVIKTAQDIVDRGLVNERTGEPYTYEEAASFMLEANKKMAEQVEELNSWAENVAEENISLNEGNQRVMAQWGDTLKAMPNLAAKLAEEYVSTQLTFDKTNSYITKMAMTPERFYGLVMPAYQKLGEALTAQQAAAQTQQQQEQNEQQQNEQAERNGLPPQRGTSDTRANTGNPMLDALVDELNKG